MPEITGVGAPVIPPPIEQPIETVPQEVPPVDQIAPEATDLAAEMGIGANIDVSA